MVIAILSGSFVHPSSRSYVTGYFSDTGASKSLNTGSSPSARPHIPPPSGRLPDSLGIPLTLEARLKYLLSRPALHQWEAELPNRYACPFYTYNRNTYFFHQEKINQWEGIGPDDIKRYRSNIVEYFRKVEREGGKLLWEDEMEANVPKNERRGLIYTVGDGVSFPFGIQGKSPA